MTADADPALGPGATNAGRTPSELACRIVDCGESPPASIAGDQRRAVAWALKELCYAAWSTEPQRAALAADAVRNLCIECHAGDLSSEAMRETAALADWTSGIAQVTRGQMAEAVRCFDLAAEAFRALGQAHHAAQTQVPKIMALSMLGQHAQAAACAEVTQREFLAQGDLRAASKVSLNLGSLHLRRDAYVQAARHYRDAAVLFARVGDLEHSVMADIGLADASTFMGDFDEALRIYARARMRANAHGYPVLEALVEESVALLEFARGNFADALAGLEGSRHRYEQLAMPQHLAIAEKQLADAYLELRLLPEALALFDQALSSFEALDMPDEQAWASTQRGRTQALLHHSDDAAVTFSRAAALFERQGNQVGASAVALARAELALAEGSAQTALPLAVQAAQGFRVAGLADAHARADVVTAHAQLQTGRVDEASALFDGTLERALQSQLLPVQVRCLTGQGLVALARDKFALAREAFSAAVQVFEEQRRALPADDIRRAFLTDHLRPYQELLRMSLVDHTRDPSPARAAQVLQDLDRIRARSLGERLTHSARVDDEPATRALRARLNWLYRRARRLDEEGERSDNLTAEMRSTEHALLERARRQRLSAAARESSAFGEDDFGAETLQDLLGDEDALIEYGVVDNRLFACVVTRAGVVLRRDMAMWPDVLEAIRAARFQIETLRHGAAPVLRHMDALTKRALARMGRLHALMWAPLADVLAPYRRLVVVPHAQLGWVPLAALYDGERFVAQRHEIAVAPSARLVVRGLMRQRLCPRRVVALGESSQLPHAAREARFVAGLFPEGKAFVGEEATIEALGANAGNADVLHLACHGSFRSDNPMFSALHLHDGALTVELAEALHLRPGIVVLSACETGLAEQGSGDEMVGLVRAFLVAGAARVLASLWPVDDAATEPFMTEFFAALSNGQTPAAALNHAQSVVMQQHPHPFYWAPFTLHGGW